MLWSRLWGKWLSKRMEWWNHHPRYKEYWFLGSLYKWTIFLLERHHQKTEQRILKMREKRKRLTENTEQMKGWIGFRLRCLTWQSKWLANRSEWWLENQHRGGWWINGLLRAELWFMDKWSLFVKKQKQKMQIELERRKEKLHRQKERIQQLEVQNERDKQENQAIQEVTEVMKGKIVSDQFYDQILSYIKQKRLRKVKDEVLEKVQKLPLKEKKE